MFSAEMMRTGKNQAGHGFNRFSELVILVLVLAVRPDVKSRIQHFYEKGQHFVSGLPDFSWFNIPKREKYTKWP
jgi:hypothetical protein